MRSTLVFVSALLLVSGCGSSGGGPGDGGLRLGDGGTTFGDAGNPPPPDMAMLQTLDPGIISTSSKSAGEAETHVAVAPNGAVSVAYIGLIANGGSTNGYRVSQNLGADFAPADALGSPQGRETSDPVLAADAQSNFYMSWVEFNRDSQGNPLDMHVYAARAMAGSSTFSDPVEVTSNPQGTDSYDKPWITIAHDGAVLVTYARTSTGGIFAARSTDFQTWSRATIVEDMNFRNLVFPCMPSSGTRIYATYHAGAGIGLRWSDDDGVTWPDANKTAVAAQGEMPAFDDPTCAADGNEVWVTYGLSQQPFSTSTSALLDTIRLAHSSDGGVTIDRRADVGDSTAAPLFLHPYLIREPGGALDLAYYAGAAEGDTMGSLRRARSTDGGQTFSSSVVVHQPIVFTGRRDSSQWLGDYFGLAWADGQLFLSYADNGGQIFHVGFYRTPVP